MLTGQCRQCPNVGELWIGEVCQVCYEKTPAYLERPKPNSQRILCSQAGNKGGRAKRQEMAMAKIATEEA